MMLLHAMQLRRYYVCSRASLCTYTASLLAIEPLCRLSIGCAFRVTRPREAPLVWRASARASVRHERMRTPASDVCRACCGEDEPIQMDSLNWRVDFDSASTRARARIIINISLITVVIVWVSQATALRGPVRACRRTRARHSYLSSCVSRSKVEN